MFLVEERYCTRLAEKGGQSDKRWQCPLLANPGHEVLAAAATARPPIAEVQRPMVRFRRVPSARPLAADQALERVGKTGYDPKETLQIINMNQ